MRVYQWTPSQLDEMAPHEIIEALNAAVSEES